LTYLDIFINQQPPFENVPLQEPPEELTLEEIEKGI
jgi:hypothetical protein